MIARVHGDGSVYKVRLVTDLKRCHFACSCTVLPLRGCMI